MSDGGGESGHGLERKSEGVDDFSRAIVKIAVAQICESVGFHSFQPPAIETLSDKVIWYLRNLGKNAHFYANSAGRTDCNVFDIIRGLEDLGSSRGLSSLSDANCCIGGSGIVGDMKRYLSLAEEIPFAQHIPHFPVPTIQKPTPSFLQMGETPDGKHIPAWLPAFPDPHTFIRTPMWNERETDPRTDKIEQVRQQRKAEQSLLNLKQRLACCGSEASTRLDTGDAGKGKQAAESNMFLSPRPQIGEKNGGSPVVLPAKLSNEMVVDTHVSVLETFAPVIEAAKSGLCNFEDGGRKVLPSKRPNVNFKFRAGKKSLGIPSDLALQSKSIGNEASWFERDDEKDDKKRRAERILKESMENPEELTQL